MCAIKEGRYAMPTRPRLLKHPAELRLDATTSALVVVGINSIGVIAGYGSPFVRRPRGRAFVWLKDHDVEILSNPPGNPVSYWSTAISNKAVVGNALYETRPFRRAVVWRLDRPASLLEAPAGNVVSYEAAAINAGGSVVGYADYDHRPLRRAIIWSPDGDPAELPRPPDDPIHYYATAANDQSQVVGVALRHQGIISSERAVRWSTEGRCILMESSPSPWYMPFRYWVSSINNHGVAVGGRTRSWAGTSDISALTWDTDGKILTLPTRPGPYSLAGAMGINDNGSIAGFAANFGPPNEWRAVAWNTQHNPVFLPPPGPRHLNYSATAINDFGTIVGTSDSNSYPRTRAVVWE